MNEQISENESRYFDMIDKFLCGEMTPDEEADFKILLNENSELREMARGMASTVRQIKTEEEKKKVEEIQNAASQLTEDDIKSILQTAREKHPIRHSVETSAASAPTSSSSVRLKRRISRAHRDQEAQPYSSASASNDAASTSASAPKPRRLWLYAACIAALVALGIGGVGKYGYDQSQSLFNDSYESYSAPAMRGGDDEARSKLESLFNQVKTDSEMSGVITQLEGCKTKAEGDSYDYAYYADDIDWYLSLAYLKAGRMSDAKPMLEAIAQSEDSYYSQQAAGLLDKMGGVEWTDAFTQVYVWLKGLF